MVTDFSKLSNVLIIRLSSLGDVLLTTPLVRYIKKKNPSIQIDFIVRKEYAAVVQNNPNLCNIYEYVSNKVDKKTLINSLLLRRYDLIVDLQNNLRSKEILRSLNNNVLSFKKNNISKFLLVSFKINKLKNAPQIPLRYAKAAGIKQLDNEGLDFYTDNRPHTNLSENENYIGFCPGAKHFTKRWPKDYFIELGKELEKSNYKIILFGGPEELEICREIENSLDTSINLCNTSLLQAGADMKMCKAIYSNDSGLMHIATALKIPVIAFFGSTVKEFGFYPYQSRSIELENKNLACRPCTHIGRKTCPKIHFKCMKEIHPDIAFNSLTKLGLF